MADHGRRLLPNILHERGEREPDRTFASIAASDQGEFRPVTYRQASNATSYVADWLLDCFPSAGRHAVIAYMGVPDVRYSFFHYAMLQIRLTSFVPSPRNTTSINASLFAKTKCTKLVYSTELRPVVEALRVAVPELETAELPSVEALINSPLVKADRLSFEDVRHDPAFILQSSGSTGSPKPITMTNMAAAACDVRNWPTVEGRLNHDIWTTCYSSGPNLMVDFFPPWHLAGYYTKILCPLITETIAVYGPPLRPPSGALAAQIIRAHNPRLAFLPPSLAEELVHEQGGLDLLKKVEILLFGGGPLSDTVGNELSKYAKLCQFYGSTEMGQIRQLLPAPEDWAYMEFHPAEPFEMQPQGDGLYELVRLSKKEHEQTQWLQSTFPDAKEWHTRDLFSPHPTKPGLWKFATRIDDILVLSNGEKLNPLPMETALTAIPEILGALVVGQGRSRPGLLLELNIESPDWEVLWSAIDRSNNMLPLYGRVIKSMVTYASPKKPFIRAGKGTVIRRQTEKLYATEIANLYADNLSERISLPVSDLNSLEKVTELVRKILIQGGIPETVTDDENVYLLGMDSIRTIESIRILREYLESYRPSTWITSELLYQNPTVHELSNIIFRFLQTGTVPTKKDRIKEMEARIEKAIKSFPGFDKKLTVAITGTTGFLGGRLVHRLANETRIAKIFCMNRSQSAPTNFETRYGAMSSKCQFKQVNFAEPMFGLSQDDYAELKTCDVIVHNAWSVDFNRALASFEDNINSVEQLIQLSAASSRRVHIVFISSISTGGVWSAPDSLRAQVPAKMIDHLSQTLNLGYAESKQVSEHILQSAYQRGIPATVVRMGQICPSTRHDDRPWPKDDATAVYLRTCKSLGLIAPDFVDRVDWVPLDAAADTVLDILFQSPDGQEMPVFNVVNPRKTAWTDLMPTIKAWGGKTMREANMHECLEQIRKEGRNDAETLERLPALRTMAIYELISKRGPLHDYDMSNLIKISPSAAAMPPISRDLLEVWLQDI